MTESEFLLSTDPAAMLSWMNRPRGPFLGISTGDPRRPNVEISDRKLRLLACACCRAVFHLLADERSRRAVEVAERYADGEPLDWRTASCAATAAHEAMLPMNAANRDVVSLAYNVTLILSDLGTPAQIAGWLLKDTPIVDLATAADILRDIVGNPWRPTTVGMKCPAGCECGVFVRNNGETFGCKTCQGRGTVRPFWTTPRVVALAATAYTERSGRRCEQCGGTGRVCRAGVPHPMVPVKSNILHVIEMPDEEPCPECYGFSHIADGILSADRLAVLADCLEDEGCDCIELLDHLRSAGPHFRGCWAVDLLLGKE